MSQLAMCDCQFWSIRVRKMIFLCLVVILLGELLRFESSALGERPTMRKDPTFQTKCWREGRVSSIRDDLPLM
jgi:hypothetical protein